MCTIKSMCDIKKTIALENIASMGWPTLEQAFYTAEYINEC